MSVKIKICGITNVEDALAGLRAGADYIGMVFYPKSPRYVSLERAEHIVQFVQGQGFPDARFIGVFVNEPPKKAAGRHGHGCAMPIPSNTAAREKRLTPLCSPLMSRGIEYFWRGD